MIETHPERRPDRLLGGLADVERDLIRTRTAEGRSRTTTPAHKKEAIRRRAQGATLEDWRTAYNVSRSTISRLAA